MKLKIEKSFIDIEDLPIQNYKNISIVPLKSENKTKVDILSLKKGLELGLVEVKECEHSTVNTIMVTNNAVTPLILVDGDEITGAKQNRIVNTTILIPPKTTMKVSVSCTEHGRWHFKGNGSKKSNFTYSNYFANSNTRRAKAQNLHAEKDCQSAVWESIDAVESRVAYKSPTSALNDSYENIINKDDYLNHFECLANQTGLIAIIDGEIRGLEIFANPQMYKDYHEKIINSYVIDSINTENIENDVDFDEVFDILVNLESSKFRKNKTEGLGESFNFSNKSGIGSVLIYEGELLHMPFFKNIDDSINHFRDDIPPAIDADDVIFESPASPESLDDLEDDNSNNLNP